MKCVVALGILALVVVLTDAFDPGVALAFKGSNGKYLSRIYYNVSTGINNIEFARDSIDLTTRFLATESDGKLLLRADDGKYLCRIFRGPLNDIEATNDTPDVSCYFKVHHQTDGTVVLQADDGTYASLVIRPIYSGIDINNFEAGRIQIVDACKMHVELL